MEQEKINKLINTVVDWFCNRIKEQYILEKIQEETLQKFRKLFFENIYLELQKPENKGRLLIQWNDVNTQLMLRGIYEVTCISQEKIPAGFYFLIETKPIQVHNRNYIIHKA